MKSIQEHKRKAVLKDRSFVYRKPRFVIWTTSIIGLGLLFSGPIYDFFCDPIDYREFQNIQRNHKSKFDKD